MEWRYEVFAPKFWAAGWPPMFSLRKLIACDARRRTKRLAAPRRAAAGVALETCAVAHQREVAAFAAGLALVAFGLGLGALLRRGSTGFRARVGALLAAGESLLLELLGGGELVLGLGLERGGAGDFRARLTATEGGDLPSTPTLSDSGGGWGRGGRRTARQNRKLVRARTRQASRHVSGCAGGRLA